jgi:hypothetical protein
VGEFLPAILQVAAACTVEVPISFFPFPFLSIENGIPSTYPPLDASAVHSEIRILYEIIDPHRLVRLVYLPLLLEKKMLV